MQRTGPCGIRSSPISNASVGKACGVVCPPRIKPEYKTNPANLLLIAWCCRCLLAPGTLPVGAHDRFCLSVAFAHPNGYGRHFAASHASVPIGNRCVIFRAKNWRSLAETPIAKNLFPGSYRARIRLARSSRFKAEISSPPVAAADVAETVGWHSQNTRSGRR